MTYDLSSASLSSHGFELITADSLEKLDSLKLFLSKRIASASAHSTSTFTPDYILNHSHTLLNISSDVMANQLVMDLINHSSDDFDFSEISYHSFQSSITSFLGPDLHAQKNNNLVFQYPESERFSELHTDFPPNSPYELVFWIPLVDCFESKTFYIVPLSKSLELLSDYKSMKFNSWDAFKEACLSHAIQVTVPYGKALVFWTGIIHGSLINSSNESRWCINARFKNLFAPCGQHNPLTYYKIFLTSAVSNIALSL